MGGYYENIRGEIVYYTCKKCLYFRHNDEAGENYCHNTGCVVSDDSDACDRFIRERFEDLTNNIDRIDSLISDNERWIHMLRTEYRKSHTDCEYYCLMDMNDICDLIERGKSIIAVKF